MTGGTTSSKIMEWSIKAARGNNLWPIKTQSYVWFWVFLSDRQFYKSLSGTKHISVFSVHWYSFLSHLCLCHQRQRHAFAQLTRGISIQSEVLGHMGTVLFIHKPQMYHRCTGCRPRCPRKLLRMSCDSSATLWAKGITSTSFHVLALPYLHSSSDHFHGQFSLLCTARNVSLSLKLLHCLWGVTQAVSKYFKFGIKGRNPVWLFLVNSAPSQQLTQYLHFQAAKMSHLPLFQKCILIVQVLSPDLIKIMILLNISTL